MNENLLMFKTTLAAFFASVGSFLGWRVIMLLAWVALMALDYLSGSLAARQNGTWKSFTAREGIGHKAGMVLIVAVCMLTDFVLLLVVDNLPNDVLNIHWPMVITPMVTVWYILTEIGSIIENAVAMGAKVPAWLPKLLNATLAVVENVGEEALGAELELASANVPDSDTNALYSAPESNADPYALMGFDHDDGSGLLE